MKKVLLTSFSLLFPHGQTECVFSYCVLIDLVLSQNQLFKKQWTVIFLAATKLTAECVSALWQVSSTHADESFLWFWQLGWDIYIYIHTTSLLFVPYFLQYGVSISFSISHTGRNTQKHTHMKTVMGAGHYQVKATSLTLCQLPTMCQTNKTVLWESNMACRLSKKLTLSSSNTFHIEDGVIAELERVATVMAKRKHNWFQVTCAVIILLLCSVEGATSIFIWHTT